MTGNPLLTVAHHLPGMSREEWATEVQAMYRRNQAISACITGELPPSDLLETLAAYCVDPDDYLSDTEQNLKALGLYG